MRRCLISGLLFLFFFNLVPNAGASVELLVWTKEVDPFLRDLKQMCQAFERDNQGITVKMQTYDDKTMPSSLYKAATEKPLNNPNFFNRPILIPKPDLLWTTNENIAPLNSLGLIEPIENIFDKNYTKKFVPVSIEAVKNYNHIWGVPIYVGNHLMLMYNKKLLKNPPQNTKELIAIALKQTKDTNQDGKIDQYGLVFPTNNPLWLLPWLGGYGGMPIVNQKPNLNTTSMTETLKFLQDLKWNYKVIPEKCSYNLAEKLFKTGKAAMIINGDWALCDYLNEKNSKLEIGLARLPKVATTNRYPTPFISGTYFIYPKYLKKNKIRLAAAKKLTEFFISHNPQLYMISAHKKLPSVMFMMQNDLIKKDPIMMLSAEQFLAGTPMSSNMLMLTCQNAIKSGLTAVMNKHLDPANASEKMQKIVERDFRR